MKRLINRNATMDRVGTAVHRGSRLDGKMCWLPMANWSSKIINLTTKDLWWIQPSHFEPEIREIHGKVYYYSILSGKNHKYTRLILRVCELIGVFNGDCFRMIELNFIMSKTEDGTFYNRIILECVEYEWIRESR